MFSILDNIKSYVERNGIPFNNVSINYSYFPTYFNQTILNYLRKYTGNCYCMGPSEYIISFDNNGSIYLMVHDENNKVNLCIANTIINIGDEQKVSLIPEINIIEESCMLKYLDERRLMIREMINNNYSNLTKLDKVKLENNIINTLIKSEFNDLIKNNGNILNKVSYQEEIIESSNRINSYIDYLNNYYMEDIRQEEEQNKMSGIYFEEPDSDSVIRKSINKAHYQNKERNNPIISANDRIDILNGYKYIYRDFAYSTSNKEIKYLNYLYKIDTNKYLLVLEPYNGTKHSKMIIVSSNDKITKEEFDKLVKYYLELSYHEFDKQNNTIKFNHTSIDMFRQKINYAIIGIDEIKNNNYYKQRIKKIKER